MIFLNTWDGFLSCVCSSSFTHKAVKKQEFTVRLQEQKLLTNKIFIYVQDTSVKPITLLTFKTHYKNNDYWE